MKMKEFGLIETKLFHFHRIFKNWGQGGWGFEQTPSGSATDKILPVSSIQKGKFR